MLEKCWSSSDIHASWPFCVLFIYCSFCLCFCTAFLLILGKGNVLPYIMNSNICHSDVFPLLMSWRVVFSSPKTVALGALVVAPVPPSMNCFLGKCGWTWHMHHSVQASENKRRGLQDHIQNIVFIFLYFIRHSRVCHGCCCERAWFMTEKLSLYLGYLYKMTLK